jgi:hypothetical protein
MQGLEEIFLAVESHSTASSTTASHTNNGLIKYSRNDQFNIE